jgi:hypothetical protein
LAKSGSFGFAKRWLLCRAKPNVPLVRLVISFNSFYSKNFIVKLLIRLSFTLTDNYLILAIKICQLINFKFIGAVAPSVNIPIARTKIIIMYSFFYK